MLKLQYEFQIKMISKKFLPNITLMKFLKYLFIFFVCFTGSAAEFKEDLNPKYEADVENRIDSVINNLLAKSRIEGVYDSFTLEERMKLYHTPGVSIAVINNGKLEWARGFGFRNEAKDSVNVNTLFMAGSVSKPVFALGVMHMKQEGKIDLDKDINEYLTSWKVPLFNNTEPKITLRELLSHTAGMTVHGFEGYLVTDTIPGIQQILNGVPPANSPPVVVDILPGSRFRYSGGGTTVAQLTVMDITGESLPEIMIEELFEPLKLTHSTYEQPLPESVQNYSVGFPKNGLPIPGGFHIYPELAAAGLWTTPGEIATLLIEIQSALKDNSEFFKQETAVELLTPQKNAPNIGIGFMLKGEGESAMFLHGGKNEGFVAMAVAYKNSGIGAVVMVNSNEGYPLLNEILNAIAVEYNWPGYVTVNYINRQ